MNTTENTAECTFCRTKISFKNMKEKIEFCKCKQLCVTETETSFVCQSGKHMIDFIEKNNNATIKTNMK